MLIDICDLTLGYDTKIVFKGLSMQIKEKDYICIVGENGTGKSTFLKGLLGLLKTKKGTIKYEALSKNEVGYLPQIKQNQREFPASVYEVVISGTLSQTWKPFYTKKEKNLAFESMKTMEIENLKNESFKELSGGQMQRVLIARALCATNRILVLDEPMASLDKKTTNSLYKAIKKINDKGIAVLLVTHEYESAKLYCNKVLAFYKDKVFFGTKKEYDNLVGEK